MAGDDMPIVLEKARVNMWNLGGFAVGLAVTAFGWGATYSTMVSANRELSKDIAELSSRVSSETQFRIERGKQTDQNFKEIRDQLPSINMQGARIDRAIETITENKTAIAETNKRVDRVVESFGGKLDSLLDKVNVMATDLAVVKSRSASETPTPQRTNFKRSELP